MEIKDEFKDLFKPSPACFPQIFKYESVLARLHQQQDQAGPSSAFGDFADLERELVRLTCHYDRRVRTFAVSALERICEPENGGCLSFEHHAHVANLCKNSEQNVRIAALRLITKFALKYPERKITSPKGFQIRLHDDAFSIVCNAMNDLEVKVRAEAAKLLGTFESVSDSFLHQTLDKKLMRNMTMLSDTADKARGGWQPTRNGGHVGGWNTGKTMGEDVPMEKQEEESQSMIPTGACGAFVTALEDEFMTVRMAAVYSLGKLAKNRPAFANSCIDHLADMFNDEIQQIRLDAIRALTPLISHGILQRDQLDTILTVVDDATADNRMALHELLAKSNLADSQCVLQCMDRLLHSLRRFPMDKFSIYGCLSAIGRNHASMVQALVTDLLDIHPIFDTPEQSVDDDFYLAKLLLVLNAASRRSVICSLVPAYALKHYRYLIRAWPDLMPKITEFELKESSIYVDNNTFATKLLMIDGVQPEKRNYDGGENRNIKTARVLEPSKEYQNNEVVRFVAGLPTGILIRCLLENISSDDLEKFVIQVEYPDQSVDLHRPRKRDYMWLNDRTVHLQTSVIVSAQRWATPASVTLIPGFAASPAEIAIPQKIAGKGNSKERAHQTVIALANAENTARKCRISVNIHPMQQA